MININFNLSIWLKINGRPLGQSTLYLLILQSFSSLSLEKEIYRFPAPFFWALLHFCVVVVWAQLFHQCFLFFLLDSLKWGFCVGKELFRLCQAIFIYPWAQQQALRFLFLSFLQFYTFRVQLSFLLPSREKKEWCFFLELWSRKTYHQVICSGF